MIRHIPNFLTLLNLLSGCLAILFILKGYLLFGSLCVGLAALFDFMDGLAARLLNVRSEMGKQLDSLADMVSFGVVPGFILYELLDIAGEQESLSFSLKLLNLTAFLVPLFSALRLAKFNLDKRQTDSFIGLPTPANTIFIASLPLIAEYESYAIAQFILNPWLLAGISIVMSLFLVSEIPLIALKFKSFSWKGNEIRYIFLLSALALLIIFKWIALPIIILLYILLSLIGRQKRGTGDKGERTKEVS